MQSKTFLPFEFFFVGSLLYAQELGEGEGIQDFWLAPVPLGHIGF